MAPPRNIAPCAAPSASPGGDTRYTLDAFGRVTDQAWFASGSINSPVDRFQYAYDRDSNVLYKNNLVSSTFSELYHNNAAASGDNNSNYDNLNRLTAMRRGTLSANPSNYNGGVLDTVATLNSTTGVTGNLKAWTLDAIGNWGTSTNSASPSAAVATDGTTQNRSHNSKNQITAVSGLTTPTYDNNGNMTRDENNHTFKYDAWNRMVAALGTTEVFAYDADNRRPSLTVCPGPTVTDSFYSNDWQLLQEGCGTSTVASQYVWGQGYVDDLVARDDSTTTGGIGFTGSGLGQRLYAEQDANYNVTSISNNSGAVQVRVIYDPYGTPQFLTSGFASGGSLPSGWEPLFQGLRYDSTSGKYDGRGRVYNPALGVWMQDDPAGYVNGSDLYLYEVSNPTSFTDPSGLDVYIVLRSFGGGGGAKDAAHDTAELGHVYLVATTKCDSCPNGKDVHTYSYHPYRWIKGDQEVDARVWEDDPRDVQNFLDHQNDSDSVVLVTGDGKQQSQLQKNIDQYIRTHQLGTEKGTPKDDPNEKGNQIGSGGHQAPGNNAGKYKLSKTNCKWWSRLMLQDNNLLNKDIDKQTQGWDLGTGNTKTQPKK